MLHTHGIGRGYTIHTYGIDKAGELLATGFRTQPRSPLLRRRSWSDLLPSCVEVITGHYCHGIGAECTGLFVDRNIPASSGYIWAVLYLLWASIEARRPEWNASTISWGRTFISNGRDTQSRLLDSLYD